MGTPTSTYSYRRQRQGALAEEGGNPSPPMADRTGIRPADRFRASLFLNRVGRRLQRCPDQTLDEAVAIEWRSDPQIPIAAIACALEAVQLADAALAEQAAAADTDAAWPAMPPSTEAPAQPATAAAPSPVPLPLTGDSRQTLWLAARFLRAQAEVQAGARERSDLDIWRKVRARRITADGTAPYTPLSGKEGDQEPDDLEATRGRPGMGSDDEGVDSARPRGPMQVLVVDDDPDIRRFLRFLLEEEGHEVRAAPDGLQALDQIACQLPDLVLLDLQMPRMTGWEVRDELQRRRLEVPVVFMTAGDRARAEAERHRVAGYLAKPFNIEDLLLTIERIRRLPSRAG